MKKEVKEHNNIRSIWDRLLDANQKLYVALIMQEYGLGSSQYVKQEYIWGGRCPEDRINRVVQLGQNLAFAQEQKTRALLLELTQ